MQHTKTPKCKIKRPFEENAKYLAIYETLQNDDGKGNISIISIRKRLLSCFDFTSLAQLTSVAALLVHFYLLSNPGQCLASVPSGLWLPPSKD